MDWVDGHDQFIGQLIEGKKMKMFEYYLTEKTVRCVVIEANSQDEADEQVEELIYGGDFDWGQGEMDYDYQCNGEVKNA